MLPPVEYTFSTSPNPAIDRTPERFLVLPQGSGACDCLVGDKISTVGSYEETNELGESDSTKPSEPGNTSERKLADMLVEKGLKEGPEAVMSKGVIETTQRDTSKASSSNVATDTQVCPLFPRLSQSGMMLMMTVTRSTVIHLCRPAIFACFA